MADARVRALTLVNDMREKDASEAKAQRKALEVTLNLRIAEAEKVIADARAAAMANVRSIATDAAAAIVERLTGAAPANQDIADAVGNVVGR